MTINIEFISQPYCAFVSPYFSIQLTLLFTMSYFEPVYPEDSGIFILI